MHFDIYTFYRYNNKELVRDMTSGAFVFPVVTLIQEAPRPLIAPQPERGSEMLLQDSREELPRVIPKPCDSDSENLDVSDSENEELPTVKSEGGVVPGASNIASQPVAVEPARIGTICPCSKCTLMIRQALAAAPTQGSGMEDKENMAVKPPSAPSPDKYSDWDDALAFVPPPAAKQRLPFSDTPGKRNVSLVPQVKGTIRKPRYDPVPHQSKRSPMDHRVRLRSDSSSRRAAVSEDM